ncbi:TPA: hypothetical protein ACIN4D_000559 [Streptococcus agalactiae]
MVKMDLGESNSQASSTATMTSSRVAAYTNLISSLGNLSGAEGLSGSAYDSAKTYASSVMIPLVQGGILLSEALSEAMTKFPADYSSQVAPESLDSEELQEQIDAYQKTYDSSLAWYNSAKHKKSISAASLESAQRSMMGASSKIEELKEKKRKLEAFDGTSSSIFDTISSLETAVAQGLSVAQGSFGSYNGTFTIPSQSGQMDWAKTIKSGWETRENLKTEYNAVKVKMELGQPLTDSDINVIMDYGSKHPAEKIPPYLQKEFGLEDNSVYTDVFNTLASNSITNISGTMIEQGVQKGGATIETAGASYVIKKSKEIFEARYSTELSNGKIMGEVPGATRAAIKASTEGVENTTKAIGKTTSSSFLKGVASNGGSTIIGVGLDIASGDSAEEAWGKAITTGVVSGAITEGVLAGITYGAATVLGIATAEVTIPLVAVVGVGIVVGTGVSIANDWATEKWPELEKFEDNIGDAVVSTWNKIF